MHSCFLFSCSSGSCLMNLSLLFSLIFPSTKLCRTLIKWLSPILFDWKWAVTQVQMQDNIKLGKDWLYIVKHLSHFLHHFLFFFVLLPIKYIYSKMWNFGSATTIWLVHQISHKKHQSIPNQNSIISVFTGIFNGSLSFPYTMSWVVTNLDFKKTW